MIEPALYRSGLKLLPTTNNSDSTDAPVAYFESMSFLEQVQFFRDTDIVISPHGAALTGVAFMPKCGFLMEIFPVRYTIPNFFGSLTVYSGHQHRYVMLTKTDNFSKERAESTSTLQGRIGARKANLCPPIDKIVDGVQEMIIEWRNCRNEKQVSALP